MSVADFHESFSEEWTHVRAPMTALVGTSAMQPGTMLWMDDGTRKLVGHVNHCFGRDGHCLFRSLPVVRAWRRVLDTSILAKVPAATWATAFDLDEVVFDYVEPDEYPALRDVAPQMNRIGDLDWDGALKPGLVVQMENEEVLLVGDVNPDAGVCDASTDVDRRVMRYYQALPPALLRKRSYNR